MTASVNASTTLGSTNYFTLQPGASKHFWNGVEVRVCNDEGPTLTALVDPDGSPCRKVNACSSSGIS
jgi:hypothetical protein